MFKLIYAVNNEMQNIEKNFPSNAWIGKIEKPTKWSRLQICPDCEIAKIQEHDEVHDPGSVWYECSKWAVRCRL